LEKCSWNRIWKKVKQAIKLDGLHDITSLIIQETIYGWMMFKFNDMNKLIANLYIIQNKITKKRKIIDNHFQILLTWFSIRLNCDTNASKFIYVYKE
jgi:hypothetical protein